MNTVAFWDRVDRSGGPGACWPWTGYANADGYGIVVRDGRRDRAHRVAFELTRGPISAGLTLDHLCRTRLCCNPAHTEPVTRGENVLRGEGHTAVNARKDTCKRGHPFTAENTWHWRGQRRCRTCHRGPIRKAMEARRAA